MPSHASPNLKLFLHIPTPLFQARVNMPGTITYPVTELIFDTVTLGAYTGIEFDMTLLLGTAAGLDDLGRVRVQKAATATAIPVARISQGVEDGTLYVQDNAYITVWGDDFRVWSRLPYITPGEDGVAYKDGDIASLSYNEEIPPVVIMGAGTAGTIDAITGLLTVAFDASESYPMADGATIVSWAWDLKGGVAVAGSISSSTVTATFTPGFRQIALTIVDSNAIANTGRRPILAINPAADPTIPFDLEGAPRFTAAGQTVAVRLLDNRLRSTYPDGCLAMMWDGEPSSPSDRSHIRLIGWHQSDSVSIRAGKTGLERGTVLNLVDVAGRLATLPGFPQALERVDPATTWEHMPNLTMRKCLHYLLEWHSTALRLVDFFLMPPTTDDYPAMRLDSSGATLFDQINSRARSMVPDHYVTCNRLGQLHVVADWMLVDVADRPAVTVTLTEDDWSELRVEYNRPPRVHVLRASAVVSSTDWEYDAFGNATLPLAFSIAPGDAFSQGTSEATQGEQLTLSQAALNVCTGHRYARMNARYGPFGIIKPDTDIWALEPALMPRVQLNISAATAAQRGLDSTTLIGLIKELQTPYRTTKEGTVMGPPTLVFEREVVGLPAQTVTPLIPGTAPTEIPPPPVPTLPPPMGLRAGVELLVGIGTNGHVHRTADFQTPSGSGGPTYDDVDLGVGTVYSWVVDPFSPGYAPGATSGAVNGWWATETDIYRLADLHGAVAAVSVFTFDEPAVAASYHWRSIQASFGGYFAEGVNPWLLCVSYYGDTAGHAGTWATHSLDGGVTWSAEVQISASYSTTAFARFRPIGVWTSPRTPGKAFTAAHVSGIATEGFVSGDWGASWAAESAIEPGASHAGTIHVPWTDNLDEQLLYFGEFSQIEVVEDPAEPLPHWGLWDEDAGVLVSTSVGGAFDYSIQALSVNGAGLVETPEWRILLAPPANAVRVLIECSFYHNRTQSGASGGFSHGVGYTVGRTPIANLTETETLTFSSGVLNGAPSTQDYTVEWTRTSGTDWPGNRDELPTVSSFDDFARWRMYVSAATSGTKTAFAELRHTARITEIELEGGHIYTPLDSLSSSNREFRLKKSQAGFISDISPSDGTRLYGVMRGPFSIRAYDSDRQYLLASVIGNDVDALPASDMHAVYISVDAAATWSEVVAPIADSLAPAGRPAFEAAFAGDSPDVLFIWGPTDYIAYSSDGGSSVDDRTGNLSGALVGIAGGPGA